MDDLKSKLKSLPKKPGVYIFRNSKRKIIYIGKALVLKNRVVSYFRGKHDAKTTELAANISDLEWIVVSSEFEALLLEARLIKQHEPKYNIVQKDSKSYLYIVIDKEFPNRIYTARWGDLNGTHLDWFGPFPSSADAKRILKIVRRIFPFRSCKTLPRSPCLYAHLDLCPSVCVNSEGYEKTISQIRTLLSGKTNTFKKILKSLEKEMKSFAQAAEFEKAQMVKNQINSLISLTQNWQAVPAEKRDWVEIQNRLRQLLIKYQGYDPVVINKIEGYDVSNLGREIIVGSMVAFTQGEPESSLYRKFNLKYNLTGQDDPEGIKNIIKRRLKHQEWIYPQLILVDGGKTQIGAAFEALKEKEMIGKISLVGLAKQEELIIIPRIENEKITDWKTLRLSKQHSELQFLQAVRDEAHRFAQKYYKELSLRRLKNN